MTPTDGVAAGGSFGGGYFAGTIDTRAYSGTAYAYEPGATGLRYALIVSPQSYEPSTNLNWGPVGVSIPGARSRWDGLGNTQAVIDHAGASLASQYPLFAYAAAINTGTATGLRGAPGDTTPPNDGGSDWYLPALDELELIYRLLKPTTDANRVATYTLGTSVGSQSIGVNPSSVPPGTAYTTTVPAQTSVSAFQSGGEQAIDVDTGGGRSSWWTSTMSGGTAGVVMNIGTIGSFAGDVKAWGTSDGGPRFRLVRRLVY